MDNKTFDCVEIDQEEETISDSFICCVCLDLLYKPIVLDCGHVSCFWCVHKSMNGLRESHCPICRHSYHHFPTICEMLHFLLSKTYPLTYNRRERQVLEEEKQMDCFSPLLDSKEVNNPGVAKTSQDEHTQPMTSAPFEAKHCSEEGSNCSAAIEENKLSSMDYDDVLCPACKQILFRPAVLNCGHVYCEACIIVPDDGIIICKVCESPHPTDFPNVCLELNNFLQEKFPKEYAARRQNIEHKQAQFQHKNPRACSSSKKSAKRGFPKSSETSEDSDAWWGGYGSNIHYGVGCDNCGVYPIIGDRYRCQDCKEMVGFDLCGDCYNTRSKRPGRFNQQHTPDHRFEQIKQSKVFDQIMFRLIGAPPGSMPPVLAISAVEDSPDGWIGIESVDDALALDGNDVNATNNTNNNTQDGQDIEQHDLASPTHHDDYTKQDGNM